MWEESLDWDVLLVDGWMVDRERGGGGEGGWRYHCRVRCDKVDLM